MYEINWHWTSINNDDSIFVGCDVTPIYILDDNYLAPGATRTSIIAKDTYGRKFNGNKDNYYKTEKEAWTKIKEELNEMLKFHKSEITYLTKECNSIESFLKKYDKY